MEKKLIATRDGLGDELVELGGKNKNIYVVDADIGKSCKTTKFAKTFPEQHVNVGIAERMQPVLQQDFPLAERSHS